MDERERPQAGPSRLPKQEPQPCKLEGPDYSTFALDESHADLRELLECLGLDELKNIAKQMKLKTSGHHGRVRATTRTAKCNTLMRILYISER